MNKSLLDVFPFVRHTRQNHALEHATMRVLAERFHGLRMAGISNPTGFYLVADVPTELVTDAALEAKKRLENGEKELAIHPNCGTNLVASSLLAGTASFLTLMAFSGGKKPKWPHYFMAVAAAVPAYIFSKPLGPKIQEKLTTEADTQDLALKMVTSQKTADSFIHKVQTGLLS